MFGDQFQHSSGSGSRTGKIGSVLISVTRPMSDARCMSVLSFLLIYFLYLSDLFAVHIKQKCFNIGKVLLYSSDISQGCQGSIWNRRYK